MNTPIHEPEFCPFELVWETWCKEKLLRTFSCACICCYDVERKCRVKGNVIMTTYYRITKEEIGEIIDLTENSMLAESQTEMVNIAKTRIELIEKIKNRVSPDPQDSMYDELVGRC
jgi:hypothetical protein